MTVSQNIKHSLPMLDGEWPISLYFILWLILTSRCFILDSFKIRCYMEGWKDKSMDEKLKFTKNIIFILIVTISNPSYGT